MSVDATTGRPQKVSYELPRKALNGKEAGAILDAAEEGKNQHASTVVLIFEHGELKASNVYKRVG